MSKDYDEFSSGRPLLEHFVVKYKPVVGNYEHFMPQMIEDILTMLKEHEETVLATPTTNDKAEEK